jgi:Kef-type K+ transport system membrane component KefB
LTALSVALVNASTGLTALYVLLVCAGFIIFLLYPVRWGFVWLARRTGSLEQGSPTSFMMTVTLLLVFISAFFTDVSILSVEHFRVLSHILMIDNWCPCDLW